MILSFSKLHPVTKKETFFMYKIIACYLYNSYQSEYRKMVKSLMLSGYDMEIIDTFGLEADIKLHTIRKGQRWKKGDKIHYYLGQPRNGGHQFWEGVCTGTQDIIIDFSNHGQFEVKIEGELRDLGCKLQLAKNDGLAFTDFVSWFYHATGRGREVFDGQIISWSDLKY